MEWSDAKTLQLIELYEKRPYLCEKVAACNCTIAAYATLSRDFVAHSRDKIAQENYRCDIGLSSLLTRVHFLYSRHPCSTSNRLLFKYHKTRIRGGTILSQE